jgi:plastocyanin
MTGRPRSHFGRFRPRRRTAALLVASGILLLLVGGPFASTLGRVVHVLPRVGFAHPLASNNSSFAQKNFSINATDFPSYAPNQLSVAPNTNITFIVHNSGIYNHTFTLSRQPSQPGFPSPDPRSTPTQVYQYFNRFGSFVNLSLAPNATAYANLTISSALAGTSLEFVSVIPYQFQAGMAGFLNVTRPLGPGVQVSDNASDSLAFVPQILAVNTSSYPVTIDVAVYDLGGALSHTWTLSPVPNATLFPKNFTQFFSAHPPLANVAVQPTPGVAQWGNFSVAVPGIYEYICTIQGHFNPPSGNMFGYLYVGIPPPAPNATPVESTAIVQASILVGGGALLGFGLLLALVGAFTGRFPKPPPPSPGH